MIVRELPIAHGRFFEMDSCNVVLQPENKFVYFTLSCACHDTPKGHVPEIAKFFSVENYDVSTPFNFNYLHVIELNPSGKIFSENLKRSGKNRESCTSSKI